MQGRVQRPTASVLAVSIAALLVTLAAPSRAAASINLELRPGSQSVFVGSAFSVDLYAVSDNLTSQTLSAAQVIITWNIAFVQLLGLNNTGTPMLSSGFGPDPYHLNDSLLDGDAMWIGFAPLGNPVAATPAGTFLTRFNFHANAVTTPTTLINIAPSGGSPTGQTIVFDGVTANLPVTGTLTGAIVTVVVPDPGGMAVLLAGALLIGRRRRPGS